MNKKIFITIIVFLFLTSNSNLIFALNADEVIVETTKEVLDRLESDKEKLVADQNYIKKIVRELIIPHMDFNTMSALALGENWNILSNEIKTCVSRGFKNLLVERYAYVLLSYRKQDIEYWAAKSIGVKGYVSITQSLSRPETDPSTIEYRMRPHGGSWSVVDLLVDDVSLLKTYRKIFNKDIKEKGLVNFVKDIKECQM
tara:strand:+ start:173 stop:772 length:600 start_codon:yes stop_codon:yes gene_type:complete